MFFSYLVFTEPGYVALTEVENTTKTSCKYITVRKTRFWLMEPSDRLNLLTLLMLGLNRR